MIRTVQIIFNALRSLSFSKLLRLLKLTLPHPLLTILGFFATLRSFRIAQKYFPKTNSNNGIGNAFRHALWAMLIMMYCCKITSPNKAKLFCKKMTDLHEELFPNEPLETKMDLHNNQIGIDLFMQMLQGIHRQFFETNFLVDHLLTLTKTAKILRDVDDPLPNELVYLEPSEPNRQ